MDKKKWGSALGAIVVVAAVLAGVKHPAISPNPAPVIPASVDIQAPAEVGVGELVVLSVEGSDASSFSWQVEPPTKHFMVIDDGRRAVFSSGTPGDYLFMVAAAKGDKSDLQTHKLKVTSGAPAPSDGLGSQVAQLAGQTGLAKSDASTLATSFLSVSAAVSAGALTDPADIVEATKKAVNASLGDTKAATPFLQGLQSLLKAKSDAGQLPDAAAHVEAWRDIATALNAYAVSK